MQVIFDALADEPAMIVAILAVLGGIPLGAFAIYSGTAISRNEERTRRELAAYVAEGSMTPEDAAMILSSGKRPKGVRGSRRA
ncbi:MAG: hypothetical protein KF684_09990 [Phycisphaeraceae bacterium]|nr:hypothetical protein [Phycisphaeraceae bacterium]